MKRKLESYINSLFSDTAKTQKAYELKEELLSNLYEKYDDLINRGYSEEEAYQAAITGIGDVSELINALQENNPFYAVSSESNRKKSALFVSVAVMLYILSIIPVVIWGNKVGVVMMFTLAAIATGLIIFCNMSYPKYQKNDETLVEEFKEWKSANNDRIRIQKSISSAIWTLVIAIYLIVSFYFNIWSYSWIIFIIGAAINRIVKLVIELKRG